MPVAILLLNLALASGAAQAQLPVPHNLRATPGDAQVELKWLSNRYPAVTGYSVRYATDAAAFSSASPPEWIDIAGSDDGDCGPAARAWARCRRWQVAIGH